MENELDVLTLTRRVYKDSSERLQSWIKFFWHEYSRPAARKKVGGGDGGKTAGFELSGNST